MKVADVSASALTVRADGFFCARQIDITANAAAKPPPNKKFPANGIPPKASGARELVSARS